MYCGGNFVYHGEFLRNAVFERFRAADLWFRLPHARTPEVWILLLHWNKMAAVSFFHWRHWNIYSASCFGFSTCGDATRLASRFQCCRHCHFMPRSIRWSCCVDLCILSELLAVVSQPVVCWSSSAEVCLLLLGSYSSAFHECMLFIAIASLNTYSVIILLKFTTFVYQMLGLHIDKCITVFMSWVHVSYFFYSHSYTCHWRSGVEFLMETVSWQINARGECVSDLSLSDLRAWMVCLWRWQCWCNTTSPPVTQQPRW